MITTVSPDTQVALLTTAPLIVGRRETLPDLLKPREYKRIRQFLHTRRRTPADLLRHDGDALLEELAQEQIVDPDRLKRLLKRGYLLARALERWNQRQIWVVGPGDPQYPERFEERLKDDAPPLLYVCGDPEILATGGLAVVGSRDVTDESLEYAHSVGRLAAEAGLTIVSGGARGVDQAAMRGALESGGKAVGVLANNLENAALNRDHRSYLMEHQLVLVSPYDPRAGFDTGTAMARNKLIYALADAALVVQSGYGKGGTWHGAAEQLEKLRFVPVYVRLDGEVSPGLRALHEMGAEPWPNPQTPDALAQILVRRLGAEDGIAEPELSTPDGEVPGSPELETSPAPRTEEAKVSPAEELFAKVRELLAKALSESEMTEDEVASHLGVSKPQAKSWLKRLVDEGALEKLSRPVRYRAAPSREVGCHSRHRGGKREQLPLL